MVKLKPKPKDPNNQTLEQQADTTGMATKSKKLAKTTPKNPTHPTTKNKPNQSIESITKLLATITTLTALTTTALCTNFQGSFPENLQIFTNDVIGFQIRNFVNGSQTQNQAFPTPTIQLYPNEPILHTFNFNRGAFDCVKAVSVRPLNYAFLCSNTNQTAQNGLQVSPTFVAIHRYKPDLTIWNQSIYTIELQNDSLKPDRCDDLRWETPVILVACYKRNLTKNPKTGDLEGNGDFTAIVYSLRDLLDANRSMTIIDRQVIPGFVPSSITNGPVLNNKLRLTHTYVNSTQLRVLLYQHNDYMVADSVTNRVFVFDVLSSGNPYNLSDLNYKVSVKPYFSGNWPSNFQGVYFSAANWVYGHNSDASNLVACHIKHQPTYSEYNNIPCLGGVLPMQNSALSTFIIKYYHKPNSTVLVTFGNTRIYFCYLDMTVNTTQMPFQATNIGPSCTSYNLFFSKLQKSQLYAKEVFLRDDFTKMIIPYHNQNEGDASNLSGFLYFDQFHSITEWHDLSLQQGTHLSPVNSSYYILHRGLVTLHARQKNLFTISSPEEQSTEVHLSSFTLDYDRQPFLMDTQVKSITSDSDSISVEGIQQVSIHDKLFATVYPEIVSSGQKSDFEGKNGLSAQLGDDYQPDCIGLGYNSKLLKGNDIGLKNVTLGYKDINGNVTWASGTTLDFIQQHNSEIYQQLKTFKIDSDFDLSEVIGADAKLKDIYLAHQAVCIFQTEAGKLFIVRFALTKKYSKKVTYKLKAEVSITNYDIITAYFINSKLFLMTSNQVNRNLELFRFNEKFEIIDKTGQKTANQTISEQNSLVITNRIAHYDLKLFSDDIYIILVIDNQDGRGDLSYVQLIKYRINGVIINSKEDFYLYLGENGVRDFRKGNIGFVADQTHYAYVINKDMNDFSLLEIDFSGVDLGTKMIISTKSGLKTRSGDPLTSSDDEFSICVTTFSIFVLNKNQSFIYGLNIDNPESSYLTVPAGHNDHPDLQAGSEQFLEMTCAPNHQSFQAIVKFKNTTSNSSAYFINSYFDFDGTQAGKKLHSQIPLKSGMDKIHTSTVDLYLNNFVIVMEFSASKDKQELAPTISLLEGPIMNLCMSKYYFEVDFKDDILPQLKTLNYTEEQIHAEQERYESTPTLFYYQKPTMLRTTFAIGDQISTSSDLAVKIEKVDRVTAEFKDLASVPNNSPVNEPLSSYLSWTGPIFEVRLQKPVPGVVRDLTKFIQINQKLELMKSPKPWQYYRNSAIVDSVGIISLISYPVHQEIILFTDVDNVRLRISFKEGNPYGVNCQSFKLISFGRTIYVLFLCDKGLETILYIITLEIYEKGSTLIFQKSLPYNMQDISYTYNQDDLFVLMKEDNGDRLLLWRIERRRGHLSEIKARSRAPGDMSLFSFYKIDIIPVNRFVVITLLSPGLNHFKIMTVDFQALTVSKVTKVYNPYNNSITFIGFGSCPQNQMCMRGITGGVGNDIQEYQIQLGALALSVESVQYTRTFKKFFTEESKVEGISVVGDYYLFDGNFGYMQISPQSIVLNKIPDGNVSPDPLEAADMGGLKGFLKEYEVLEPVNGGDGGPETGKSAQNRQKSLKMAEKLEKNLLEKSRKNRHLGEKMAEQLKDGDSGTTNPDANIGVTTKISKLIYHRDEEILYMRSYGDAKQAKIEILKDGSAMFVAVQRNQIRFYKLGNITFTELTVANDRRTGAELNPKLVVWSYGESSQPHIYLSIKDVSQSYFLQIVAIITLGAVVVTCLVFYRIAKRLDLEPGFQIKKDLHLFSVEEVDKRFTDQNILSHYFGDFAPREKSRMTEIRISGKIVAQDYEEDKIARGEADRESRSSSGGLATALGLSGAGKKNRKKLKEVERVLKKDHIVEEDEGDVEAEDVEETVEGAVGDQKVEEGVEVVEDVQEDVDPSLGGLEESVVVQDEEEEEKLVA